MSVDNQADHDRMKGHMWGANYNLEQALGVAHFCRDDPQCTYQAFRAYHTSLVMMNTLATGAPAGWWARLRRRASTLRALFRVALMTGPRDQALKDAHEEWQTVRRQEEALQRQRKQERHYGRPSGTFGCGIH